MTGILGTLLITWVPLTRSFMTEDIRTSSMNLMQRSMLNQAEFENVEEHVLQHPHELARYREYQNSLLLVNNLPTETLSEILLATAYKAKRGTWTQGPLDWLGVTQVCRHWRAVALGCPLLWSELDFRCDPAFTDLMISRAGTAPLAILLGLSRRNPNLDTLFLYYQRFSVINIQYTAFQSEPFSAMHKIQPSASLQRLIIGGSYKDESKLLPTLAQTLSACPNLTHLDISCCPFYWNELPAPPSLQYLRLHNPSRRTPTTLSWMGLRTALASMTALHVLDFEYILVPKDPQYPIQDSVSLPHLKELCLVDSDMSTVTNFLSNIQLPKTTKTFIHLDDGKWEPTDGIDPIVQVLSAFKASRSSHTTSAGAYVDQLWKIRVSESRPRCRLTSMVKLWVDVNPESKTLDNSPTLALGVPCDELSAWKLVDAVKATFDMSGVRSLSVSGLDGLGEHGWAAVTQLPKLETIHLLNTTLSHFGPLLCDQDSASQLSFPAIRNIIFEVINFEENKPFGVWFTKIVAAAMRRQKDHPLHKISLLHSRGFTVEDVEMLRKVVEVDWNGKARRGWDLGHYD